MARRADERSLRVLQVAYPFAPVGFEESGGAEQIVAILDEALADRGHHSVVLACPGSRVAGELVPGPALPKHFDDASRRDVRLRLRAMIDGLVNARTFDVVHMHGLDYLSYLPPPGPPVLVTLHLPPSYYEPASFRPTRPKTHLVCVSTRQLASCPESSHIFRTIPNGIRLADYSSGRSKGGYALALGRICPEKGYHLALDAAKMARCEMLIAGPVFAYEEHERYFRNEIAVRLDAHRRYVGPVGLAAKRDLLAGARCLVVPSLVPETSSLVVMEALASGTPVVAFPSGAIVDILRRGRTGIVVSTVSEMAEAMQSIAGVDPTECRRIAREYLASDGMVASYLDAYGTLARGSDHAG